MAEQGGETDFTGAELTVCTWGAFYRRSYKGTFPLSFEARYGCTVVFDEVNANATVFKNPVLGRIRKRGNRRCIPFRRLSNEARLLNSLRRLTQML